MQLRLISSTLSFIPGIESQGHRVVITEVDFLSVAVGPAKAKWRFIVNWWISYGFNKVQIVLGYYTSTVVKLGMTMFLVKVYKWLRRQRQQEAGVHSVTSRLPIPNPSASVCCVHGQDSSAALPAGGGQRIWWRQCMAASPLSGCSRASVAAVSLTTISVWLGDRL